MGLVVVLAEEALEDVFELVAGCFENQTDHRNSRGRPDDLRYGFPLPNLSRKEYVKDSHRNVSRVEDSSAATLFAVSPPLPVYGSNSDVHVHGVSPIQELK